MRIVTLMENKSIDKKLKAHHGLSLYIEFKDSKILFDLGPNKDFMKNAKTLGIDLKEVDFVIVSHGHYDHATELNYFLEYNKKAKVFVSRHAFESHVGKVGPLVKNIGIPDVIDQNRIQYVDQEIVFDNGMIITPNVAYKEEVLSDERLYIKKEKQYIKDDFNHEIYLILKDDNISALISGCSHKGIKNVVDTLENKNQLTFTYVIGGFHLKRFNKKNPEHVTYLDALAKDFSQKDTTFYACHCTGDDAFSHLNVDMRNLRPLHTGNIIEL